MADTVARQKVNGIVTATLKASGKDFVTSDVDQLEFTYQGVAGDYHEGLTRLSGAREPWYPRGVEMRNERQVSVLASDELVQIALNMGIEKIEPGWIGSNLVIDGIKNLSLLPPRTVLMFEGGVTLRVDGYNAPCLIAGGSIVSHVDHAIGGGDQEFDWTKTDLALAFVPSAHLKRGLVVWVEREGVIAPGEKVVGHVWEQRLYQ